MNEIKQRRKELGVSLDELAAALGSGFSRARLSVAERGLIELYQDEQKMVLAVIERIGALRSEVRSVVKRSERVNLAAWCADLRHREQVGA
jgi:transcriptional regulator with XRE-family HTH domain